MIGVTNLAFLKKHGAHFNEKRLWVQLRSIIPFPTGRFVRRGAFRGTSCQATIGLSLRYAAPSGHGTKGQENLAQGLPWVSDLSREALKGPRYRGAEESPGTRRAPSGLITLKRVSQGKPWATLSWPVGPKTGLVSA
jgi:hypothetical protein